MAAISPRIHNKEDTQTGSSGIKLSKVPTSHALPSSGRFKDAANCVIAISTRRSSTGMHHDAPSSLHSSEPRSFNSARARRNSLSDVVARTMNGVNRTASECATHNNLGNTGLLKANRQNSSSNPSMRLTSQGRLASGNLASTSSKISDSRAAATRAVTRPVAEKDKKSDAGIKDSATQHKTNELCKNCRNPISRMESICFITNDGRISAAPTGALHARHSHHCNVGGCARNQSYHQQPPSVSSSKRDSLSRRQALLDPQPTRKKSVHSFSETLGLDHGSTASSDHGDDVKRQEAESSLRGSAEMSSTTGSADTLDMKKDMDLKEVLIKYSEDDAESCVTTNSPCHMPIDQNGRLDAVSPCQECSSSCSPLPQVPIGQESYVESMHMENNEARSSPVASSILSDTHGDDDEGSAYRDDIQALNDFQGHISYHGDNEYSCSEGGTDATTTPISSSKGAFDDLSNIDIEQSHSENGMSQSRRSTVARITQKFLESLTEQEAEKVRLRKKETMARKQAGDWMLDCHMEEVLHRLAPTGEAHVKVLVEAFETVMHQSDSDCSQTAHHTDQEHVKALFHAEASS